MPTATPANAMSRLPKQQRKLVDDDVAFEIPGCERIIPKRSLKELVLPEGVLETCVDLCQEQFAGSLLTRYGLEPRNRVLFYGPPGTGKTALAGAIAKAIKRPLFLLRCSDLIGGYMGESTQAVGRALDAAKQHPCVILCDEAEGLLSKRSKDTQAVAMENIRVLGTFLTELERLPPTTIFIAATNLLDHLDPAALRRFHAKLELPKPTVDQIAQYLVYLHDRIAANLIDYPASLLEELADRVEGQSYAEVEMVWETALRRAIIHRRSLGGELAKVFPAKKESDP